MKKSHYLLISILMIIVTTIAIFLAFCLLDATYINLLLICVISMAGYGTSALYYFTYKEDEL